MPYPLKLNHFLFNTKPQNELNQHEINSHFSLGINIIAQTKINPDVGLLCVKERNFKIVH